MEQDKKQYLITFGGYNIYLPTQHSDGNLERIVIEAKALAAKYQQRRPAGSEVRWAIKQLKQYEDGERWDVVVCSQELP